VLRNLKYIRVLAEKYRELREKAIRAKLDELLAGSVAGRPDPVAFSIPDIPRGHGLVIESERPTSTIYTCQSSPVPDLPNASVSVGNASPPDIYSGSGEFLEYGIADDFIDRFPSVPDSFFREMVEVYGFAETIGCYARESVNEDRWSVYKRSCSSFKIQVSGAMMFRFSKKQTPTSS
jgi:hypothetical protein